ncbi:carboxypeptidase-like regulatory domain-containing protein, partial [Klebsiella pneumoniae]|uniref:carboxypeptidase-like regulatory domain-containing protein n=1 Tax=Klebsiella pneumoniae TaxID=573 RepID=UPI003013DABA
KFSLLPVGSYQMTVEQASFRRYDRTGILLQANENVKVDVTLEIGDVKSTVTVNAAASQVETEVATLKETVDQKRIVDLPLNGRDAAQLALLV